jgi:hypothetical protein
MAVAGAAAAWNSAADVGGDVAIATAEGRHNDGSGGGALNSNVRAAARWRPKQQRARYQQLAPAAAS